MKDIKDMNGNTKVCRAANLLVSLLAGTEMPSKEVYRLVKRKGISSRTLERAKLMVSATSHPVYDSGPKHHVMTVPEDMKGQIFGIIEPEREISHNQSGRGPISSDWISVAAGKEDYGGEKIEIPISQATRTLPRGGFRIKVGMVEFEADENFPADKLAELLRGLGVAGE